MRTEVAAVVETEAERLLALEAATDAHQARIAALTWGRW
jgi:hypothetical protein